jgi:hypothetical protein
MSTDAPKQIEGVLLCQVADHFLAFPARSVSRIETWSESDVLAQHARWAFDLPSAPGKVLEDGAARLVVDALEIHSELAGLFPVPQVLVGAAGGALAGFVQVQARLWPLVELSRLCRFLAEKPEVQA